MNKRHPPVILATCCIPWKPDGTFTAQIFRRNVRRLVKNLTPHIYLFGTAGEGHAVTDRQFDQIINVFWQEMSRLKAKPMVGVISLSLGTVLERIERARDMGFRSFQISLPSWGALNDRELMMFFEKVCGGFPDCSFLHYNLMRTKRLITPAEYGKLAREFPNLVATKNSTDSPERVAALMNESPQLQHFFTEAGYGHGSLLGECGFLISVASINFRLGRKYYEAGQRQDARTVQPMQRELRALTKDLIATVGSSAHIDGAYDKMFCKLHDPAFPLRLLPPYATCRERTFQEFRKLVRRKYPRWLEAI
jgi:dihydrodipicolinate synthase/N-acetylneuraminate lyase